ncbi:MAG: hypothetical protein GXO78_01370 [Calditrichaeota bacterium]|nr:hypothetical protein [Calditrichota bacterium]
MLNWIRRWNRIAISLVLLLWGAAGIPAQSPDHPPIATRIEQGMYLTIMNQFAEADSVFQGLIRDYPDRPFGYFYRGANLQAWMVDHEDYSRMEAFQYWMDRCVAVVDSLEQLQQATAWDYFYKGSAYLYQSFLNGKQRQWWQAYRNSRQGVHLLEKALALDSTLFDAYLGIGSYKFWKSKKAGILTWLPFLKNEADLGLELVRLAIEKGRFVKWIGRDQLTWMLLEHGQLEEALELARGNVAQFPESRFFNWTLARVYEKAGLYREARQVYEWLLSQIRQLPETNHYNEVVILARLVDLACKSGAESEGEQYLRQLRQVKLSPDVRSRLRKTLSRLVESDEPCGASYQTRGMPWRKWLPLLEQELLKLHG